MRRFKIQTLMVVVAVVGLLLKLGPAAWTWFQDKKNYTRPVSQINSFSIFLLLASAPLVGILLRRVALNDVTPDPPQPNDDPEVCRNES